MTRERTASALRFSTRSCGTSCSTATASRPPPPPPPIHGSCFQQQPLPKTLTASPPPCCASKHLENRRAVQGARQRMHPRPSPRTSRTRRVPHPVLIGHACPAAEDASSHRANDHPCSCSVPPASVGSLRGRAPQVRGRRGRRGAPAARAAPAPPRHARACERARRRRRGAPPPPQREEGCTSPFP